MTADEKHAITRAVEEAEGAAGVEVVVVGYDRADGYGDALFRNTLCGTLLGLALVLLLPVDIHHDAVFPLVAAAGAVCFVVSRFDGVLRLTTTKERQEQAIASAVASSFLARGVHKTRERVGLLVVWFDLEQQVRVVFDMGLEKNVPKDVRDALAAALSSACLSSTTRAPAIADIGKTLGPFVPKSHDDVDELANAPTKNAGVA